LGGASVDRSEIVVHFSEIAEKFDFFARIPSCNHGGGNKCEAKEDNKKSTKEAELVPLEPCTSATEGWGNLT
jgi:hypothetical protein